MTKHITTIQIHKGVKHELDRLKENANESYEKVILELINQAEKQKREDIKTMIEGYKETAAESLKITKDWSKAEAHWE